MTIKVIALFGAVVLLAGCASMDSSAMSYKPDIKDEHGQRVFIWKSNYSAGIASKGGVCAQGALTAEARSSQTTASVSTAIIDAVTKVPNATAPGDLAKIATSANNNIVLTNASNGQTAFANIAFFYLCQIALNNTTSPKLTGDQLVAMWKDTNEQVAKISSDSKELQKLLSTQATTDRDAPLPLALPTPPGAVAPVAPIKP